MDSISWREGRLIVTRIGAFAVSLVLLFALISGVALHRLNRIHEELDEFSETEIPLTRVVTEARQLQLAQRLALEKILTLQATGGETRRTQLEEATAEFRKRGDELERDIKRGIEIAAAARTISTDVADEYRNVDELLLSLQREHREFEDQAEKLVNLIQTGESADLGDLLDVVEREAQDVDHHAERLLLELGSFMEETAWQVEVHGRNAIGTIGLVAALGALVATIFAAYVLFSTFSHMEKRRRMEEALQASEARHLANLSTLRTSAAELATLARQGEITRHVEQQLGADLGLDWAEVCLEPDSAREGVVSESISFRGEQLGTLACGPKRSGESFSTEERQLVRSVAEQAAVALHNAMTIGALREVNESLLRNARLVAIGEFAAAVAHGIRNPLAGIRAAAQAAHKKAPEGAPGEALATIMAEADRLNQRIRSLLNFSRPYDPALRKTDLRELLGSVSRLITRLPESAGTRVITELPREAVEWEVDPDYLEDALLELSLNALRAMPDGGELRLRLERHGRVASISVSDTGPGIPEGVRDHVFDLFFTTHPEGTGMGLATVKKIIEAHDGTLDLLRTGSDGTVFRVDLCTPRTSQPSPNFSSRYRNA